MEDRPRRALVELTPEAAERFRDPRVLLGLALIGAGALAVALGYWGVSDTLDPGKQLPYIISGGIGGVFLLGAGAATMFSSELAEARSQNVELQRLVRELGDEVRTLRDEVRALPTTSEPTPNGRRSARTRVTAEK